jgi:hypothetical protein
MSEEARERCLKHRREHPELRRQQDVKRRYGITKEEYELNYKEKKGICPICKNYTTNLHIDHNHETGKIRKMICFNCNKIIGNAKDDVNILAEIIKYLNSYS